MLNGTVFDVFSGLLLPIISVISAAQVLYKRGTELVKFKRVI